eukprot:maker-scaffold64_size435223-snap-gene-2.27 protein:Tk02490 transcript:maker-scaffold64_size435223-snap-gene-2.27-mRNA-1 annotation:"predicted protein"
MGFSDYHKGFVCCILSPWIFVFFYYQHTQNSSADHSLANPGSDPVEIGWRTPHQVALNMSELQVKPVPGTTKSILYYTPWFRYISWGFGVGGPELFEEHKCSVTNCLITSNRSHFNSMSEFDALLFHMRNMNLKQPLLPNQKMRQPNQRYVMMLVESPLHDRFDYRHLGDVFNWTMTYRMNSDIPRPYGIIYPRNDSESISPNGRPPWKKFIMEDFLRSLTERPAEFLEIAKRPKLVAWMVSNCHTNSERESYANELAKFINVTVMGKCGPMKCKADSETKDICLQELKSYKFCLSFENSICDDYVTEKFFQRAQGDILTIVMGGANYDEMAPPHSHLNVKDFKSPQALAKYLKYLDGNDEAYLSYFWWKDHYQVATDSMVTSICKLCEMLHADLPSKTYPNMTQWWLETPSGEPSCRLKGSFPWSQLSNLDVLKSKAKKHRKV